MRKLLRYLSLPQKLNMLHRIVIFIWQQKQTLRCETYAMAIVTLWRMEKSRTIPVFPGATKTRDPESAC